MMNRLRKKSVSQIFVHSRTSLLPLLIVGLITACGTEKPHTPKSSTDPSVSEYLREQKALEEKRRLEREAMSAQAEQEFAAQRQRDQQASDAYIESLRQQVINNRDRVVREIDLGNLSSWARHWVLLKNSEAP